MGWRAWLAPGAAWALTTILAGAGAPDRITNLCMAAATLLTLAALFATRSDPRSEWDHRPRRVWGRSLRRRPRGRARRNDRHPMGAVADEVLDAPAGVPEPQAPDGPVEEPIDLRERLAPYEGCAVIWPARDHEHLIDLRETEVARHGRPPTGPAAHLGPLWQP